MRPTTSRRYVLAPVLAPRLVELPNELEDAAHRRAFDAVRADLDYAPLPATF